MLNLIKDPTSDNPYLRQGFKNRADYLYAQSLAFGLPLKMVKSAANLLGPIEDFDALLVMLDEMSEF